MHLSIRPAGPDDEDWLFTLHEAAMRPHVEKAYGSWDAEAQRASFLARDEPDVRMVFRDGTAVGAVRLRNGGGGLMHIGLLEVLPAFQGEGIGTSVLRALDEEAARAGDALALRVRHGNRARRLYDRLGFRLVGEDETHAHLQRG